MNNKDAIKGELALLGSAEGAIGAKRFFKTGKGGYAQDDIFIGVSIPQIRAICRKWAKLVCLEDIGAMLCSSMHEERMLALLMLVEKFRTSKLGNEREALVEFYLRPCNIMHVNNWDLVDASCYKILGQYIVQNHKSVELLYKLSESSNLWERRIAIVSTMSMIKIGNFEHTIALAEKLMNDDEDLISKAIGWMLREVRKKNETILINLLDRNVNKMKRITICYAIERLSPEIKEKYKHKRLNAGNC